MAAGCHIHVRNPETGQPTPDTNLFKETITRIAKELGIEPATPDEARQILGLKGLDKVNY